MAGPKSRMHKSLSHQGGFPNVNTSQTNSASLAQAEREIKNLQEENIVLKEELRDIRSLYKQLVSETTHENFDERRINLLKSQVIQLERQLLLHHEALGSRSEVLLEVENAVDSIADCCRSYLSQQDRVGAVTVNKHDLNTMLEISESTRLKLNKTIENTSNERLKKPLVFLEGFVKHNPWESVTLMDVCSGNLQHINLKHVSKLESQLAQLYKELSLVQSSLLSIAPLERGKPANKHVPHSIYSRLGRDVTKACDRLNNVTPLLLELSVLVPSAPWPALKKSNVKEVTLDAVMERLPNFPKSRAAEGREQICSLLKAMNFTVHMSKLESQCLKDEVKFHQDLYNLQLQYIDQIAEALRDGYMTFEENTHGLVCKPMKDVFAAYAILKESATEDALRHFLSVFRKHADNIFNALDRISAAFEDKKAVDDVMDTYRDEFQLKMNQIHDRCTKDRDKLASDLNQARLDNKEASGKLKRFYTGAESSEQMTDYESTPRRTEINIKTDEEEPVPILSGRLSKLRLESPLSSREPHGTDIKTEETLELILRKSETTERRATMEERPPWDESFADVTPQELAQTKRTPRAAAKKSNIEDRPPWDSTLAVGGVSAVNAEHDDDQCTCGVDHQVQNKESSISQLKAEPDATSETNSPALGKPPTKPPKRKRVQSQPKHVAKPMPGVPQSRLSLKPTRQSVLDAPKHETDGPPSGRSLLSPIRRSGSLSSIDGERITSPMNNNDSEQHRNPSARQRRAESLNRTLGGGLFASSNNLDNIYPAVPSSSSLKNSLGVEKPWK